MRILYGDKVAPSLEISGLEETSPQKLHEDWLQLADKEVKLNWLI